MRSNRIISKFFVLGAFLLITGCAAKPPVSSFWMKDLLENGPKNASPTFQQGWRDGCESGISLTANSLQRHFYKFKQDGYQALNREYYTAWSSSYIFCERYVYQNLSRKYF
jgi:hypothetical protein